MPFKVESFDAECKTQLPFQHLSYLLSDKTFQDCLSCPPRVHYLFSPFSVGHRADLFLARPEAQQCVARGPFLPRDVALSRARVTRILRSPVPFQFVSPGASYIIARRSIVPLATARESTLRWANKSKQQRRGRKTDRSDFKCDGPSVFQGTVSREDTVSMCARSACNGGTNRLGCRGRKALFPRWSHSAAQKPASSWPLFHVEPVFLITTRCYVLNESRFSRRLAPPPPRSPAAATATFLPARFRTRTPA